jgi:hypothetical protein
MRDEIIKVLDVVALLIEKPDKNLLRGQIGTVIEKYSETDYEIEFCDNSGKTIAFLTLDTDQIMLLHFEPALA